LGAVHVQRNWVGDVRLTDLSVELPAKPRIRRRSLRTVNV